MDSRIRVAMTLRAFEDVRKYTRPLAISSPFFENEVEQLEAHLLNTISAIAELQQENKQLKTIQNMSFADGVLWHTDAAFCPDCGINHNKVIPLNESVHQAGVYFCPECFNSFYTGVTAGEVSV